jgi:hypothetical protein
MSLKYTQYIGIDISLTSTACSIFSTNTKKYTHLSFVKDYTKPTKWTKLMLGYDNIHINGIFYKKCDDYSTQELYKIDDYENNMQIVIDEIKKHIAPSDRILVRIEGYSYGSMANSVSLLDLVSVSSILRNKLRFDLKADIQIMSPSSLKMETSKLVYGYTEKGKKNIVVSTRNAIGIAGGNFTKRELFQAINDYPCESELSKFCKENYTEIYSLSKIFSPLNDVIDSYWLLKTLMNDEIFHIKNIIK